MAFPQTPLAVIVEMLIGGVWTDVTQWVYIRNPITIERGRKDEGKQVDPGRCTMTLNNRDGRWSSRKPDGPYYGLIGRNTPVRVSVDVGASYLATTGTQFSGTGITTPDAAALDIVGDIDIRFEATLDNWLHTSSVELCGKGATTGDQRSWLLLTRDRKLHFEWSTAGVTTLSKDSTVDLPVPVSGRLAVRVTLDVDNGASGNTVTFYTGPSISGPWTQLGAPVVTAGVTSIFNSTAPLRVGDGWSELGFVSSSGAVHAFELRNGLGGSVVANPDFTVQTPGAASFTDGTGKLWTVGSLTSISNRKTRFAGEIAEWPVRWDVSGKDVEVSVEAVGILRRIGQGKKALPSTLRRRIPSEAATVAYWPLEEEAQATQAYSPIAGVPVLRTVNFDYGSDDTLLGSSALPTLVTGNTISMDAVVPSHTGTGNWMVSYVYFMAAAPSGSTEILEFQIAGGTVRRIRVTIDTDSIDFFGYDADGTQVVFQTAIPVDFYGSWNRLECIATTTGGNVNYHLGWVAVDGGGSFMAQSIAATAGTVSRINTHFGAPAVGLKLGHLGVFNTNDTTIYDGADDGFQGELAAARVVRLTGEESVPCTVHQGVTMAMGAQRPNPLLTLLGECADTDGGILYEDRMRLALAFRPRVTQYNQTPALALNYAADGEVAPPLEPSDDDQRTRNDVTVVRAGGSSARTTLESGALSVQAPPAGVGPYEESVTLSLYTDGQALQQAAWRMHLGTWDEARYPVVRVDLAAAPHLIDDVIAVDGGDRLTISNPPAWLPPDAIDLLAQGYTEVLGHPNDWDIRFNCTPGGPWQVGVIGDPVRGRADTAGAQLAEPLTTTETDMDVLTTVYPLWVTDPAQFPFDLRVGGEVISATAATSSVLDTFTRTVADGWGTPTVGAAWTNAGGSATDFDVNGSAGTHTMTTVNVSRRSDIPQVVADFDLIVDVASNDLASGGSQFVGLMARVADANNLYMARVEFTTAAAVVLTIRKRVGGVETELGTFTTGLTHVANTFYRLRFQGVGSLLRARIWTVTGTEPEGIWHVQLTDTALTAAGGLGVRSILATGNTDVNPVMSYDNFASLNPQTFTVTRSVNGVVKTHSAGAAVRLAHPMRAAL